VDVSIIIQNKKVKTKRSSHLSTGIKIKQNNNTGTCRNKHKSLERCANAGIFCTPNPKRTKLSISVMFSSFKVASSILGHDSSIRLFPGTSAGVRARGNDSGFFLFDLFTFDIITFQHFDFRP
jgi:hypothetical protein